MIPLFRLSRRSCTALLTLTLAWAAAPAAAQSAAAGFPNRPIRFVVPFPAGAGVDALARTLSVRMAETLGQPVVVGNKPGGNTAIGTDAVAKAPGDGYTILMTATSHMTTPLLTPTTYDAVRDFVPVATVSSNDFVLVIPSALPIRGLQELIAYAKARPGVLNYSSSGGGNPNHLAGELFDMLAGVKTTHVPYKGGGPAVTDLVAGVVQMHYGSPANILPHIRSGKLRPLAVSGAARLSSLPDVPTFAEAGVKDYELSTWYGVLAPRGTPREVVERLRADIRKALAHPSTREKFDAMGMELYDVPLDRFAAVMRSDQDKYARIIKVANVKLD